MAPGQDNKEKLIEVACNLFATRGFRGTSIRDIARDMNMSISNIYHHFGNKEGLLLEILKHASFQLTERLHRIEEKDLDPLERFRFMLHAHLCFSMEHANESKIFSLDEEHLTPEGHQINLKIQREILQIYVNQLRILEKGGYIRSQSLTIMAFNIIAVMNWHLRWFKPDGQLTFEDTVYEIIHFILHGILNKTAEKTNYIDDNTSK